MAWLYEPKDKTAKEYLFPIHSEDAMMCGFTYQHIIVTFNASEPVKTEEKLKDFIRSQIEMAEREMWENYDLCREKILEECGIAAKKIPDNAFEYGGYHFVPKGKFPKNMGFKEISKLIGSDRELKLSRYEWGKGWSIKDFYMKSTEMSADIFLCIETGKVYCPGENELFLWLGEV